MENFLGSLKRKNMLDFLPTHVLFNVIKDFRIDEIFQLFFINKQLYQNLTSDYFWQSLYLRDWEPINLDKGWKEQYRKRSDTYIFGFGDNHHKQIGNVIMRQPKIKKISAGGFHNLVLLVDGQVLSFGLNNHGQLGSDKISLTQHPNLVNIKAKIIDISAGEAHNLLLDNQGEVWSFGNNYQHQCGYWSDLEDFIWSPKKIKGLANIKAISAGKNHNLVLTKKGKVLTFGNNNLGQLGRETELKIDKIRDLPEIVKISAGAESSLLIDKFGSVWVFGNNEESQLGLISPKHILNPINLANNFISASLRKDHSLIIDKNLNLWAAGLNYYGQLGLPINKTCYPLTKTEIGNVIMVAVGDCHTIWLDRAGDVWFIGYHQSKSVYDQPIKLMSSKIINNTVSIAAGKYHSLVLRYKS